MSSNLFNKVANIVLVENGGHVLTESQILARDRMFRRMVELHQSNAVEALRGDDFFIPFDELLEIKEGDEGTGMDCPQDAQVLFTMLWCHALATGPNQMLLRASVYAVTDVTINGL